MSKPKAEIRLSRRHFLQAAGLAASLLAAPPALTASASVARPRTLSSTAAPLRVAVLLPQSTIYPLLGQSLLGGMRLGFADATAAGAVRLSAHDYGRQPSHGLDQARRLVESGQVDLLVGMVSRHDATALDPLLRERQVPLVVSDIGANIIRDDRQSPYITRSSLGHWQASWALGEWAARAQGARALIASSFYESGYDTLYAFRSGFEGAGGTIAQTVVTDLPTDRPGDLTRLFAAIRQARPDTVYAAYSGPAAVDFVRAYARAGLNVPLIGGGFLVPEELLASDDRAALGVTTASSWPATLDAAFTTAYQTHIGRRPDPFATLGYETAGLIADALRQAGPRGSALAAALGQASFSGPRGPIAIDPATSEAHTPLYLSQVQLSAGVPRSQGLATLPSAHLGSPALAELRSALKSGWVNAYLCL